MILDPTFFGCDAKLSAEKLKVLSGQENFSFLADDHGIAGEWIGTTDTIYQCTKDVVGFMTTSFLHAANDLWCNGANLKYCFLNIGLTPVTSNERLADIQEALNSILRRFQIVLVNAHSYASEVNTVTWTLIGEKGSMKPPAFSQEVGLYLTDELGAGYLVQKGFDRFALALTSRNNSSTVLPEYYEGTTDISGFGLMGSLLSLQDKHCCSIKLDIKAVPAFEKLEFLVEQQGISCSAKQNLRSFGTKIDFEIPPIKKQVLFGGEINGPLLILADEASKKLSNMYRIGTCRFDNKKEFFYE